MSRPLRRWPLHPGGALLLLLLATWCLTPPGQAQAQTRRVDCQNADFFEQRTVGTAREIRMSGNVVCRQEATWLYADRVIRFALRDEVQFQGNVRMIEEGDSLYADRVVYDQRRKVGEATGAVRLSDGEVVLRAPSAHYFSNEKRSRFEEGVTLVDSASVLASQGGAYFSEEKRAEFYGAVRLDQDQTHLEADSVTFFRETDLAIARGNVFIERFGDDLGGDPAAATTPPDTTAAPADTARTYLFGTWAYNDNRQGLSRVRGRPLLVQLQPDTTAAGLATTDTLLIRAGFLEATRTDSLRRLVAVDSVQIWQRDFAAVADSVVYDRIQVDSVTVREEIRLYGGPMAWFERTQVSGDTLRVTGRSGVVDSLFARGQAFVAQQDTVLDRIQQLRGRRLVGLFDGDALRRLDVGPQAETIYFMQDDDGGAAGAVQASADRIVFTLDGDRLQRLTGTDGIEGLLYAVEQIPAVFTLPGFRWVPMRRPTRAMLLRDPVVRERLALGERPEGPSSTN